VARHDPRAQLAIVNRRLVDTGPLVAYIDSTDAAHAAVTAALDDYTGRLFTTSAVVTEAMHLVSDDPSVPELLVEFMASTSTHIAEMTSVADLQEAVRLMRKYSDTPMDFADATLVILAGRFDLTEIFTLDRRGFSTFRTPTGKAFRLWPTESRRR
jgi:predicted nucleic acid-binding protein